MRSSEIDPRITPARQAQPGPAPARWMIGLFGVVTILVLLSLLVV